jgi:cobalt-zinc-cadmium efflux system membrane fusion protein
MSAGHDICCEKETEGDIRTVLEKPRSGQLKKLHIGERLLLRRRGSLRGAARRMHSIRVAAVVMLALVSACRDPEVRAKSIRSPSPGGLRLSAALLQSGQVRIEPVRAAPERITVRTSGKAGFDLEHLSYVSSPLVGRVVDIRARLGEHVEAGQTLAVIDSPDLGSASSEFIKARADLTLAQRANELAQQLWAAKAMARKDVQRAEDEYVKAKTDLRRTRERLLSLSVPEAELDRPLDALHVRSQFNLTAPIGGTVVERNVTLGQIVGGDPAQRLYVVADLTQLWVTADIYEKDLPLIHPGEEVRVHAAPWPQERFQGRIDYVGDTVDPTTRTVKVRLTVDNRRLLLKPEMFVTASIHTGGTTVVLTVSLAAVHGEGSEHPYVFTALENDRFERRPVTLGAKSEERVAITAGLTAQDRVVTDGSILLNAESDQPANG